VTACGSSTVTASGSSTVTASGSSTVTAYDSSTVRAYDSSTVTAGAHVALHLHSGRVHAKGGVVIDHTMLNEKDPQVWCDYHGVTVTDGIATVYKAVNDEWTTSSGTVYAPGTLPSCDDFAANNKCGGGLHFGPTPEHARRCNDTATRFLAVGVRLDEMSVIPGDMAKVKAPRVVVACVEVDSFGRPVVAAENTGARV
jgi:hypothetical protein